MGVFLMYYAVTAIIAAIISFGYSLVASRTTGPGWTWANLFDSLIFIALSPVMVPWWIVEFIRANRRRI